MENLTADMIMMRMIMGGILVLIGKIVWDWLKNRGAPPASMRVPCAEQESCPTVNSMHEEQIRFSMEVKNINEKLDKGDEKFDDLQKDVGDMKEDIAVMAAIMKERHQTGGELFQPKDRQGG